jgi:hypothetical protein
LVLAVATGCAPSPVVAQPPFTRTPAPASAPAASTSATTASLSADYAKTDGTLDKAMLLNGSQGGYSPMRNLNWFAAQAAQLSSVGLHDVRIDHVFDDAYYRVITVGAGGAVSYDFDSLDRVVLPLVRNGMTPFFSLSYSPTVTGAAVYEAPISNAVWAAATTALVKHYKDLGLSGLNWEVWNEIDSLYTYTGTLEQYEKLYVATVAAVKAADPTAKVGGAATSTIGVVGGWSYRFLAWLRDNPAVVADFFSYHSYYIGDFSDGPTAQAWLKATGRDIPIYITEWNNSPAFGLGAGKGSDTNASDSGASYVAKRMFTAIGAGAAKLFWFSPVEGADPTRAYTGDLGLYTVDGHRKALGNVFEMYSRLDPTRLAATVSGSSTANNDVYGLVTKDSDASRVTALLWNNTATESQMTVSLSGLPYSKTDFAASRTLVSQSEGNGFADTSTTVEYRYPSPHENAPVVSETVLAGSGSYSEKITIPANGITQLTLTPSTAPRGAVAVTPQPSAIDLASAGAGATVTTSSSALEDMPQGWATANLTDGRRHSFPSTTKGVEGWSSAAHRTARATESATVDLGKRKALDSVVLWPRDSVGHQGEGFPSDFAIAGSVDGKKWTTLSTSKAYSASSPVVGPQTFPLTPAAYRYVRVIATRLARPSTENGKPAFHLQLTELEVYRTGVANGGVETGSLAPAKSHGSVKVESTIVHGGNCAVMLSGAGSSVTYSLVGLTPKTTYTFGLYARSSTPGGSVAIAAADFGGASAMTVLHGDDWAPGWVTFTTGDGATAATVSVKKAGGGDAWMDDATLTSKSGQ